MNDKPKLKIFNRDGTVTEVEPIPMWQPCIYEDNVCKICGGFGGWYDGIGTNAEPIKCDCIDEEEPMNKIDEIKQALAKATPGLWAMIEPIDEVWQSIDNTKIATVASNQDADANLHLIANATEWLQWAVQEIERLREERDKLIEGLHNYMKELDRRGQKAYQNSVIDSDHHQLGMAEAYEVAERRLRDILKEIELKVK